MKLSRLFGMLTLVLPVAALPANVGSQSSSAKRSAIKTFTYCQDAHYLGGSYSAHNSFGPIGPDVARALGFKHKRFTLSEMRHYKVTLIQAPTHGQVNVISDESHHWHYTPDDGYEGPDRVAFAVEGNGKQVKVVVNFLVVAPIMADQEYQCRTFNFDEQPH